MCCRLWPRQRAVILPPETGRFSFAHHYDERPVAQVHVGLRLHLLLCGSLRSSRVLNIDRGVFKEGGIPNPERGL